MSEDFRCHECGAGLPADTPGGLCPACLMRLAAGDAPVQPSEATAPAEESGLRFGPYTTVRLLGEGGMGIVYLARQEQRVFDLGTSRPALSAVKGSVEIGTALQAKPDSGCGTPFQARKHGQSDD